MEIISISFYLLVHELHLYQFQVIIVHDDGYLDIVLVEKHVQEFESIDHQNKFEHGVHDFLVVDKVKHSLLLKINFSR